METVTHRPFTTDGCSDCGLSRLFWIFRQDLPAELDKFCREHDEAYWRGGTALQRWEADQLFRRRIRESGHPVIAEIYYRAVRIGGVPWLPTWWRWGYGIIK